MSAVPEEKKIPTTHYDEPAGCQLDHVRQAIWQTTNEDTRLLLAFDYFVRQEQHDFSNFYSAVILAINNRDYEDRVRTDVIKFNPQMTCYDLWKTVNSNRDLFLDVFRAAIDSCPPTGGHIFA